MGWNMKQRLLVLIFPDTIMDRYKAVVANQNICELNSSNIHITFKVGYKL